MRGIELSTMAPRPALELDEFEHGAFVHIRHHQYDWVTGWNNVLQTGLYQKGPDVSEVGSTWLQNLNDMRALRPFSVPEVHAMGGEMAFLANSWSEDVTSPLAVGPRRVTSIPWTLDTRLIYYRRDLLAQAGVAEEGAFATPEAVMDTLARLQAAGLRYPLGLPTGGMAIHNLASWVWGRGGRFRSQDYHKIDLVRPEGLRGMADYFRMHRFIDPATRGADYAATHQGFFMGHTAVMLSGQWVMRSIKAGDPQVIPAVREHIGYALPPGVPFVGSTHLVIWRHALQEQDAIHLIAHLTSPQVLARIFEVTGNFPARLSTLNAPPFAGDADYRLVTECLRNGRTFRSARLWAGVEVRLNGMCDQLWSDLFADPNLNLEAEIDLRVHDLASRLEKTLLANW